MLPFLASGGVGAPAAGSGGDGRVALLLRQLLIWAAVYMPRQISSAWRLGAATRLCR